LEKKHLVTAAADNIPLIDIGDLFDLMQGKYDPRKSYTQMRPEHVGDDYLDLVQDSTYEFYKPFAKQFAVLGTGNHEASVLKRNQVDVTRNLARRLQRASGRKDRAFQGGFSGWIIFRFMKGKDHIKTMLLKYHHGQGGGDAQVTKGVIQTNRRAVYLPDANIITTAHIHESWVMPIKRERISQRGTLFHEIAWHVSVPTYKDEYLDGKGGFHIEKGRPPKPVGCSWLEFTYNPSDKMSNNRIVLNAVQDIM
jgi:hypothetical protein